MLIKDSVVFRELDGEAVILDLDTGTYYGLNETGTRIWQLLGEGADTRAIVETVAREYDAEPAAIERDVARLLSELQARHLVLP